MQKLGGVAGADPNFAVQKPQGLDKKQ